MRCSLLCQLFPCVLGIWICLSALQVFYLQDSPRNDCSMTYMFPSYRLLLEGPNHPRYRIFSYIEGGGSYKYTGRPILFIPGHKGSHKQVRSIASNLQTPVMARVHGQVRKTPFDVFTIDFRDEPSGLSGCLFEEQANYVSECIRFIETIYENEDMYMYPIILIGHSIGGVIALSSAIHTSPSSKMISTVITLAAPLARPPLGCGLTNIYNKLRDPAAFRRDLVIVHIIGGETDNSVPASLAIPRSGNFVHNNFHTVFIPEVMLPADHLCILWCNELVRVISRAISRAERACVDGMTTESCTVTREEMYFNSLNGTKYVTSIYLENDEKFRVLKGNIDNSKSVEWTSHTNYEEGDIHAFPLDKALLPQTVLFIIHSQKSLPNISTCWFSENQQWQISNNSYQEQQVQFVRSVNGTNMAFVQIDLTEEELSATTSYALKTTISPISNNTRHEDCDTVDCISGKTPHFCFTAPFRSDVAFVTPSIADAMTHEYTVTPPFAILSQFPICYHIQISSSKVPLEEFILAAFIEQRQQGGGKWLSSQNNNMEAYFCDEFADLNSAAVIHFWKITPTVDVEVVVTIDYTKTLAQNIIYQLYFLPHTSLSLGAALYIQLFLEGTHQSSKQLFAFAYVLLFLALLLCSLIKQEYLTHDVTSFVAAILLQSAFLMSIVWTAFLFVLRPLLYTLCFPFFKLASWLQGQRAADKSSARPAAGIACTALLFASPTLGWLTCTTLLIVAYPLLCDWSSTTKNHEANSKTSTTTIGNEVATVVIWIASFPLILENGIFNLVQLSQVESGM
eukprot:gene10021-2195_t